MLSIFPTEILLEIIQCLPFTTIASLPTLSRSWAAFMTTNESSIYHSISKRYGYASEGNSGAITPSEGWKAWFVHKFQTELRWIGKLPGNPYQVRAPRKTRNFHKIEVDEEAGYVINTFLSGGLVVSDIHDHRILWSLEEEFFEAYSHCEYDEGYLTFDRTVYTEVWRRRTDVLDIPMEAWPSGPHNKPDEHMSKGNRIAENRYLDADYGRDPDHLRGQFVPWALLVIPIGIQAFRLVRGTLLVSNSQTALLYDIEKAELQQIVEIDTHGFGDVQYVDINEEHMFVVRALQLNVYERATGSLVLSIPAGRQLFDASPRNQLIRTEETLNHGELGFRAAVVSWANEDGYFHAVHVSSCGKHLAILTSCKMIVLVQDFWRLFPILPPSPSAPILPPTTFGKISKQVYLCNEPPSRDVEGCLAYHRGKVAVASTHGIYVLVLDSILDRWGEIDFPPKGISLRILPKPSEHEPPWSNLRLREVRFCDAEIQGGRIILCLRLTATKLYFSVFPDDLTDERGENMWCYDFASPPLSM